MMSTQNDFRSSFYTALIGLAISVYGFFGSLGHLMAILLVVSFLVLDSRKIYSEKLNKEALWLYWGLTSVLFVGVLRSVATTAVDDLLHAVGPMFPIAFVGLIVVFGSKTGFHIPPLKVSTFACVGIIGVYLVFCILFSLPDTLEIKQIALRSNERISLLTGNPIPFSVIVGGLSLYTLLGWHDRSFVGRVTTLCIAVLGIYAATIWAGSRGATLGIAASSPFIVLHLTQSKRWSITYIIVASLLACSLIFAQYVGVLNVTILDRITSGIETVFTGQNIDSSNYLRMHMWMSSLAVIVDAPIWGHGLTERFHAIQPHLPDGMNISFSHSHNDILGSGVIGGMIVLVLALVSFIVLPLYVLSKAPSSLDQKYLAFSLTPLILVIANSNTIYFNDSSSSFFAFSVGIFYLIRDR